METVQLGLFDRETVVVVFRGTEHEMRFRLRTQGRERRIVRMDRLGAGNSTEASPVSPACSTHPSSSRSAR